MFISLCRLRAARAIVPCLLLGLSSLPVHALPPLVVRNDPGGLIGARSAEVRALGASGRRVELRGTCLSACTLYLALPNACIDPRARFGFHGPAGDRRVLPKAEEAHWVQKIAGHYNAPLRDWYLRHAAGVHDGYLQLSGRQLIELGYRPC